MVFTTFKGGENHVSFAAVAKTAEVIAMGCKCLMRMGRTLNYSLVLKADSGIH